MTYEGFQAPQDAIATATARLEAYLETSKNFEEGRVLRDEQVTIMEDLYGFLLSGDPELHGYISVPTGVGKTVLFTELVKVTDLRTLVLTPTKLLLGQTEAAFNRFSDQDLSIGKVYSGEKNNREDITLTTYASFVRQTKDPRKSLIAPGQYPLMILDEAHRALADETKRALSRYTGAILIGFTATENYSDKRKLISLLPKEIHKMTIHKAVTKGLITPFNNILVDTEVDVSDVRVTATNEYDTADLEKKINTEPRNQIALDLYQGLFPDQKAIIFCNGVEHSKNVAAVFSAAGVNALAVHGGMSTEQQTAAKQAFDSDDIDGIKVLCNDKILTEGFDSPTVGVCLNLAPTLSTVRAQQRGGRVLRLDPAYPLKHAYIVDFVDRNYRKPPVLFSDPKVAEAAQIGIEGTPSELSNYQLSTLDGVRLIVSPEEVAQKAHDFSAERATERQLAPEGWLTVQQIKAIYGYNPVTLANELKECVVDEERSEWALYHSRGSNSKTLRQYFSPELVKRYVVEKRGTRYYDFVDSFPDSWIEINELEREYSPQVLKSMKFIGRKFHNVYLVDNSVHMNGYQYLSKGAQNILRVASRPLGVWKPVEELCDEYDIDEVVVERLCNQLSKHHNNTDGFHPCWWMVGAREILYISPFAQEKLVEELERMRAEDIDPIAFVAGQHKPSSPVAEAVGNFPNVAAINNGSTLLKVIKKKKELEDIYDAFA